MSQGTFCDQMVRLEAFMGIFLFCPKTVDSPLGKKSIFGRNTNILLKASNRIGVSEPSLETLFRPPNGPRKKK